MIACSKLQLFVVPEKTRFVGELPGFLSKAKDRNIGITLVREYLMLRASLSMTVSIVAKINERQIFHVIID